MLPAGQLRPRRGKPAVFRRRQRLYLARPRAGARARRAHLHHAGHLHRHGLSHALGRLGRARAPAGAARANCCALTAAGLEPKRLRTVAYKADAAPNLVLVEARRGGKPGLTVSPPLALCTPDGTDSDEIRRIYHRRTQP
ncbi:MAG: hypothetical protein ACLUNO_08390 [Oscillospiraceae bacterium]